MKIQQIEVPMSWGFLKGQIFGDQLKGKPMLALHGYMDNSNSFRPLAQHLCKNNDYYIIAIDLPGQGLSSKISSNEPLIYSLKSFVYSVRKVVKYFQLSNFIFLTHSFGCLLAIIVRFWDQNKILKIKLTRFMF